MYRYESMCKNHEIIKEFCNKHRRELTVISGVYVNFMEIADYDEYVDFMNSLDQDEFVGNYLAALLVEDGVNDYRAILNGDMTFDDFVKKYLLNDDCVSMYYEKLN